MPLSAQEERTLLSTIRDLQDRLYVLERQRTPSGAIPRGEGITVLDRDDGTVIAQIGDVNGADGLTLGTGGAALTWDQDLGLLIPYENMPFVDGGAFKVVTSGTFVETWRSAITYLQSSWLKIGFQIANDAATTCECRVRIGSYTTAVLTVPTGTWYATGYINVKGSLTKYAGSYFTYLEARRITGVGNCNIYVPLEYVQGSFGSQAPSDGVTVWGLT